MLYRKIFFGLLMTFPNVLARSNHLDNRQAHFTFVGGGSLRDTGALQDKRSLIGRDDSHSLAKRYIPRCEPGSWKPVNGSMAGYTMPSIKTQRVVDHIDANTEVKITTPRRSEWYTDIDKDLVFQDVVRIGVSFEHIFEETYHDGRWRDFKSDDQEGFVAFTATLFCDTGKTLDSLVCYILLTHGLRQRHLRR